MYPENPEGTQVIVGSMNMGYISDTARNRTHNLFRPKREPIPLGHSDGLPCHHPHILTKDSYSYSIPYISPLPPLPFYRPTPNHPHSYALDAQTTSVYHASPHPPKRLYKFTLHFLYPSTTLHTSSHHHSLRPGYADSQPSTPLLQSHM